MPRLSDGTLTLREFFATDVFSVRSLAVLGVLLGLRTILGLPFLTIYLAPGFRLITFAYIPDALAAAFYGPIAGLAFGFAGDSLGFIATGGLGGPYFPGFAISEMVTCFIFACFFFRRQITLPRIIIAWALNLFIVLLGLNLIWLVLMFGRSAGEVFTWARVFNNAVQSPLHILILYLLLTRLRRLEKYLY
ncbi:MAG: folate family ECF transporter S component [Clostridiales bacterium]|nr:folate family ECF transporter S component [Clostridiales bacterium]